MNIRPYLLIVTQVAVAYDELHPRTRAALLAVSNAALKTSVFKLDNEQIALLPWMEAAGLYDNDIGIPN